MRFYFHLESGNERILDFEGAELADLKAATVTRFGSSNWRRYSSPTTQIGGTGELRLRATGASAY